MHLTQQRSPTPGSILQLPRHQITTLYHGTSKKQTREIQQVYSVPLHQKLVLTAIQSLAVVLISTSAPAALAKLPPPIDSIEAEEDFFQTAPESLSSTDESATKENPNLGKLLEGNGVQTCTRKCVPTCIRGGQGAPGLGPMSVRKEIVVFKEGYRTRQYCLSECIQVCALQLKPAPAPAADVAK